MQFRGENMVAKNMMMRIAKKTQQSHTPDPALHQGPALGVGILGVVVKRSGAGSTGHRICAAVVECC